MSIAGTSKTKTAGWMLCVRGHVFQIAMRLVVLKYGAETPEITKLHIGFWPELRRAPVMKQVFFLSLFFLTMLWKAQSQRASFFEIDWAAQQTDAATPEALAQQLTAPYHTEREKVRAIFRWITEHIAYAVPQQVSASRATLRYKPLDSALSMKSADEIIAYTVLQNRKAVCNGYARLFKTLCGYAGIRAELVTGFARGGWGHPKFRSNHTWNAVFVDSVWRLLDATWASGYITFDNQFVKDYDDAYFFPDPQQFIDTHFPEDLRWSCLPAPPAIREFSQSPFRPTAFVKYNINRFTPATGIIDAAVGDTLKFQVSVKEALRFAMATEPESDSMLKYAPPGWEFLKPELQGNEALYRYVVPEERKEWIHLLYNNDVILRYRLNIRRAKS